MTDCHEIIARLGGMGSLELVIQWSDHNCIPHQEKFKFVVQDGKPTRLVVTRAEAEIFETIGEKNET